MILDPNDPTGIGLFSKFARNHASKFKTQRSYVSTHSQPKIQKDEFYRKKVPSYFSFDKQQSRQQRQKKYKQTEAPPVGHYHPTCNQPPKLVWDILKVYNKQSKPTTNTQSTSQLTASKTQSDAKLVETMENEDLAISNVIPSTNIVPRQNNLQTSLTIANSSISEELSKSQCMVNMSRMTGRKEIQITSIDWGNVDIMRSVGKMKGRITKNIYLAKQPKEKLKKYATLMYSSSYNCNYDTIKPREKGLLNFSTINGRYQKASTDHQYSYQHYDFNSYVWENQSQVYPNTKTHLVSFDKQKKRQSGRPSNKNGKKQ